jgi:hypothetical protein
VGQFEFSRPDFMLHRSTQMTDTVPMVGKGKRPRDTNQLAKWIVDQSTGGIVDPDSGKNPAAVALGRLGGLKGGKARANKLSSRKRKSIAEKAAKARWAKP